MIVWEYYVFHHYGDDVWPQLELLGKAGWELVCREGDTYIFKRPKQVHMESERPSMTQSGAP